MGSSFYVFGGYGYGSAYRGDTIAGFYTNTKQWKKLGYLNKSREGHGIILHQGQFIVVGGHGLQETERCILKGDSIQSFQCTTVGPELLRGGCQLCKYQIEISYRADFLGEPSSHYSKHFGVSNFKNSDYNVV